MFIKKILSVAIAFIFFTSCATTASTKKDNPQKCIALKKELFDEQKFKDIDYLTDDARKVYLIDRATASRLGIDYRCLSSSHKCIALKKDLVSESSLKEKGIDYLIDEGKGIFYVDQLAAEQLGIEYQCVNEKEEISPLREFAYVVVAIAFLVLLVILETEKNKHENNNCSYCY